ncbi:enhancer of mRNA-decapping protein 3 [Toxorhynchites rutilus septentrionalis]|uniref:enhancer of mRNA-decapping protein 3 n=1 Tax=Toxorhynchites rutilus septentrionalis TaxID=329112 RepID=UPI00247A2BDB|nr:enhancer of mRNA-decapping protein 3 [Toxorhynchites rutilus septentrionalis]
MSEIWVGKAVSIHCLSDIGVFQGVISRVSPLEIVITRAVRNGIPFKRDDVEVTLNCKDIERVEMLSDVPCFESLPSQSDQSDDSIDAELEALKIVVMNAATSQNKSPKNTNVKQASKSPVPIKYNNGQIKNGFENGSTKSTSRPIDIAGAGTFMKGVLSTSYKSDNLRKKSRNGNGNNYNNRYSNKNSTFGTPVDDPIMDEEFDFEKNLALFDKQAIWDEIESYQQRPDTTRQRASRKKYRHDENVLTSEPAQYRQIELISRVPEAATTIGQEYVTDEGLVIPSIPRSTRDLIQQLAENRGLSIERQNDLLARGASEIALQLLGGSRRLTPNNQHQWPRIVIICDEPYNARLSEIGIVTGRLLACHGLAVILYVTRAIKSTRISNELELYEATGNVVTFNAQLLPSCDLIIATVKSRYLSEPIRKWISVSRAPVLAIDPPVGGIDSVPTKCSILPILPLNDLGPESACGRLYLCNLGIPNKFFVDAGVRYKSPFDKAIIPIHRRTE